MQTLPTQIPYDAVGGDKANPSSEMDLDKLKEMRKKYRP
jgi:hypothetical protein